MGLFDDGIVSEERFLSALERIAICLEVMSGMGRPDDGTPQDVSAVNYVDDRDEVERELRKEAYRQRTGKNLSEESDVPRPMEIGWDRFKDGQDSV